MELTSLGPVENPLSPYEQLRSDFVDAVAELVANAQQAGVSLADIQADLDGLMSVQMPDEEPAEEPPAPEDWVAALEIPAEEPFPWWEGQYCSRSWHDGDCCPGSRAEYQA